MNEGGSRVADVFGALRPSGPVIGLYVVASVLGAAIAFSSATGSVGAMIAATTVASVAAVVLLLGAQLLPWNAWSDKPWVVAGIFVIIAAGVGTIRGFLLVELSARWGIESSAGAFAQLVNSAVSAAVWLTLAALVVGGRDRYRRRYRALLLHGDTDIDWDEHPNVRQVKARVGEALLGAGAQTGVDLFAVAEAIRREIDTNIRPLSHRLWFGSEDEEPRTRLSMLVRDAVAAWTVPMRTVLIVWFATSVLGSARWLGGELGLLASVISTVLLLVMIVVVPRLLPESVWMRGLGLVVGSVAVITGTDLVLRLLGYPSRVFDEFPLVILLPISLAALVVTAAAISLAESDRRLVLQVAEQEANVIAKARRQSAYLHNSLQSELTGLAMQLEQAAQSGSSESARSALARVHALLARSVSEDFASFQENPQQRMQRVIEGWEGICAVRIDVEPGVLGDHRIGVCLQAIEEVIANAVRHSGASRVEIYVSSATEGLSVRSSSDGRIPTDPGSGLGSAVLATVAPRGVLVESGQMGAVLTFTVE
jgi:signal transduction histidine kinase